MIANLPSELFPKLPRACASFLPRGTKVFTDHVELSKGDDVSTSRCSPPLFTNSADKKPQSSPTLSKTLIPLASRGQIKQRKPKEGAQPPRSKQ